jgi:hypothetical protein
LFQELEEFMDRDIAREPVVDFPPASLKRVSWSAVFAGVVVALVVQLALSLLGLGIGAGTINPLEEADPTRGLWVGSAIWFALSTIIALFAGGWVAGRLAGVPRRTESLLHGLVTWGATTLVAFWLLGTTVGALVSGTANLVGQGLQAAAQAAASAAPAVQQAMQQRGGQPQGRGQQQGQAQQQPGADAVTTIRQRAGEMMQQTGAPEARPESLHNQAKEAVQNASNVSSSAAQDPRYSDQALEQVLDRIDASGTAGIHPSDRQDLSEILVARTGMSREEANARIAQWEKSNQAVMQGYEQEKARTEQRAREAGAAAASAISRASIATFFMLLLGAIAGALGGMFASPRDIAYGIAKA